MSRPNQKWREEFIVSNSFIDGEERVTFYDLMEARDFASDTNGVLDGPDGLHKSYEDGEANIPCAKCGRVDLPLHFNRQCPECFDPGDKRPIE